MRLYQTTGGNKNMTLQDFLDSTKEVKFFLSKDIEDKSDRFYKEIKNPKFAYYDNDESQFWGFQYKSLSRRIHSDDFFNKFSEESFKNTTFIFFNKNNTDKFDAFNYQQGWCEKIQKDDLLNLIKNFINVSNSLTTSNIINFY